jgi:rhodanese-related sulfurtransferase
MLLRRMHVEVIHIAGATHGMRNRITALRILVFCVLFLAALNCQKPSYETFPVEQVAQLLHEDTSAIVLDVRTPQEFRSDTGHLSGAILIPVQELDKRIEELQPYQHHTIIVYCRSGRRSARASEMLTEKGFSVINMGGGIKAWMQAKLPLVKN